MSDPDGSDSKAFAINSITCESDDSNNQQPALSEISPGDKPWDKHRSFADKVEGFYRGSEFSSYGERIHYCSELLQFGLALQEDLIGKDDESESMDEASLYFGWKRQEKKYRMVDQT